MKLWCVYISDVCSISQWGSIHESVSRSMLTNTNSQNPHCVYTVNRRSWSGYVLCIALYFLWYNTDAVWLLLLIKVQWCNVCTRAPACTCVLVFVVKFYSTYTAIMQCRQFYMNPDWSRFWEFKLIWIHAFMLRPTIWTFGYNWRPCIRQKSLFKYIFNFTYTQFIWSRKRRNKEKKRKIEK